jgi:signal transduction histidine kinase
LPADSRQSFGLELNGEVILGRDSTALNLIDLAPYDAAALGVSRHHLILRPTPTNLYVVDLASTNGTLRNGRSIGMNTPYPLHHGDVLTIGRLQLMVEIIDRPSFSTAPLEQRPDLAEALSQIAKAITSQLDIDEVLNQVAETAMLLTAAGETGIWLVDEKTGELFLEAERGVQDERIRRLRLPIGEDTFAGQVIKSGRPLRAHHKPGGDPLKVKTNYLVEALVYVPITLGGVTLGVLSAVHRQPGKQFNKRDEQLLSDIADFAAIAIQNARLYQSTDQELANRVKELTALNEVARAVSASLDLGQVYDVLVEQVNRHWPVESVHLYLTSEQHNTLYPLAQAAPAEAAPVNEDILWQVAKSGKAMISNNAPANPAHAATADTANISADQGRSSVACVPLSIQDRVVGVLALLNKATSPFTTEDLARLETFANPVATAVENARLFAESERRRAAIQATAQTLPQPLLILDEHGTDLVANQAANQLLEKSMPQLFEGVSRGIGRTTEVQIGDQTYLSTAEHIPEVGTIVIMQDITYVKQLEKDRSEFLHALSHDLKNPLTSMMGWTQLLERVTPPNEQGQQYIGEIKATVDRMVGMINQLLQIARGDAVQIVRRPCRLEQIVTRVRQDVQGAALGKSITIAYEQEGEPTPILADETRLYHMALNLVDNAIKYSPKNTHLRLQLHFAEEAITLKVQDEGPGIPEKDLERIFDKYYRGTQANIQPGSGLGLSVVRAIAEAHHGDVVVRNRPEGGAEFIVTLPGAIRTQ